MDMHFRASHAFIGCGVRVRQVPDCGQSGTTTVTFADDSAASAHFKVIDDESIHVWIDDYTTEAGNVVKARAWRVERPVGGRMWKVVARVGEGSIG